MDPESVLQLYYTCKLKEEKGFRGATERKQCAKSSRLVDGTKSRYQCGVSLTLQIAEAFMHAFSELLNCTDRFISKHFEKYSSKNMAMHSCCYDGPALVMRRIEKYFPSKKGSHWNTTVFGRLSHHPGRISHQLHTNFNHIRFLAIFLHLNEGTYTKTQHTSPTRHNFH